MSKIRKAAATLMLMSSVNTVCLGDALRGLGAALRGLCSGDRRLQVGMAQMQREHDELVAAFHRANAERVQAATVIRANLIQMQEIHHTRQMELERRLGFLTVPTDGGVSKTMIPPEVRMECISTDDYWEVSKTFTFSANTPYTYDIDDEYTTEITVTNPSQANGVKPLQIWIKAQRRIFSNSGEEKSNGNLILTYIRGQWVGMGGHDPIYDEMTRRFSITVTDSQGRRWIANARTKFTLMLN